MFYVLNFVQRKGLAKPLYRSYEDDRYNRRAMDRAKRDILEDIDYYEEMDNRRGYRKRTNKNHYDSLAGTRKELINELKSINSLEKKLSRVRNPQLRKLAREIVGEAEDRNMTIDDVLYSMQGKRSFLSGSTPYWILGVLAALFLLPSTSGKLREIMRKATGEFMDLSEKTQTMVERVKEEFEDIVAEAQFNKFKDAIDPVSDNNN